MGMSYVNYLDHAFHIRCCISILPLCLIYGQILILQWFAQEGREPLLVVESL